MALNYEKLRDWFSGESTKIFLLTKLDIPQKKNLINLKQKVNNVSSKLQISAIKNVSNKI